MEKRIEWLQYICEHITENYCNNIGCMGCELEYYDTEDRKITCEFIDIQNEMIKIEFDRSRRLDKMDRKLTNDGIKI